MQLPDNDEMTALIQRAGAGDREAFTALFDALGPWVHAALLRMLRDEDAAELLTRRTMVEIWKVAPLWDQHVGRPLLWALATARNLGTQWLDGERRRHAEGPATTPPTEQEKSEARADSSQVGQALAALGEGRDALEAAWFAHPLEADGVKDVAPSVYGPVLRDFARVLAGG